MLAIVIPYYKLTFFDAVLQSLAIQTDQRFKVYIGDDASPEDSSKLLKKYQGKFDFIYHRFEENIGGIALTQQWERCIAMTGDEQWIMILGDDDVLQENCVASFYVNLSDINVNDCKVIRFATQVINQDNKLISDIYYHPQIENSVEFIMRKFKGGTRSSLSEFVFYKKALLDVQFKNFPLAWFSDLLAVLEVSNFGLIYTITDAVVSFRLSGENITSKTDNLVLKNEASFQFYYYLLDQKTFFFDNEQIAVLQQKLEKTFLDNKKNGQFWIFFTKLYWSKGYFENYMKFLGNAGLRAIKK